MSRVIYFAHCRQTLHMSTQDASAVEITGLYDPPTLSDAVQTKVTAGQLVQLAAYKSSGTVFTFSGASFNLASALKLWASKSVLNDLGEIPSIVEMEARAGSGSALAAYCSETKQLVSVILSSAAFKCLEPQLRVFEKSLKNVVFHVASVEYVNDKLVSDVTGTAQIARRLDLPVYISSFTDVYQVSRAVTESVKLQSKPVVHVFDGLRGLRQAFTPSIGESQLDAFTISNLSASTEVLYISAGFKLPASFDGAHALFTQLSSVSEPEFYSKLPQSIKKLVVLDFGLYKLVSAASSRYFNVDVEFITPAEFANSVLNQRVTLLIDSDSAVTARTGASLTKFVQESTAYTVFDNTINGGTILQEISLNAANNAFVDAKADVLIVNNAEVLKTVDLSAYLSVGAKLAVAGDAESVLKKVEGLLPFLAANSVSLYSLNYSLLDTQTTEGWTALMASEAAVWLLNNVDLETATSRVVHSLGSDMELVAATVNEVVRAVSNNTVLQQVPFDAKTASEEAVENLADRKLVPTSFVPFAHPADLDAVTELGPQEIEKRILFRHAFNTEKKLKPEVSAKTFIAKVKQNVRVTPLDYERHIFELELDISNTGMQYAIGESLGVHSPNNSKDVLEFLEFYKIDPEQPVSVPLSGQTQYKTAFQVFENNLDLFGKVQKRFFEALAPYATDAEQKTLIARLGSAEGAEELKARQELDFQTYADVLKEFTSAKPSLPDLVGMIPALKRREYSIASSQHRHPNEVHLLIVVVDWKTRSGETRYGQCSKYLSQLSSGAEVVVSVKPSVTKLPADSETPIIMAGLGTGLAPFKAFLEEKQWQKEQGMKIGPVYLFLGSRHRRQEYLYGELFEAYKAAGVLTHIGAAFSRDQKEKVYIQHRIQQAKEELVDAFVKREGSFYLCGPTWPVPDVSAALTDIVVAGSESEVDTENLIEDLKEAERYILEVY